MNRQQTIVKNEMRIKILIAKAPNRVVIKAKQMIIKLINNEVARGMRPKVLKRNKNWLSYRVNRKYRVLVLRSNGISGPYYCLSHAEFDHWVNKH
ncbi:hypothetical protein L1D52_03170 [Vibrio brasiliensis]|uniref:ParE family toxin-like protein n=1 Tax=Vibrio brasiliensis TaxID=170652 RepID=UPI001EFC3848|nr:hypothetical protein [Vibrio brasiliensis]MCG9781342.1 hypothetical protein [Vibrio brasiliensis]